MALLAVRDLSIGFEARRGLFTRSALAILSGVGFDAREGEMLALVGASGVGKSLLAQAIFGLLPADARMEGEIRFCGQKLDHAAWARLRGRRMALVPQSVACLDPQATAGRQIERAARRAGNRTPEPGRLVERFGLPVDTLGLYPHELSGGMARRVLLAIACAGNPSLIVADEPTAGLDETHARIVLAHLRALADEGRTVLLVTHDLAVALPFADRVVLLREGRVAGEERAGNFAGQGEGLSPESRRLWRALPQNGFHHA